MNDPSVHDQCKCVPCAVCGGLGFIFDNDDEIETCYQCEGSGNAEQCDRCAEIEEEL